MKNQELTKSHKKNQIMMLSRVAAASFKGSARPFSTIPVNQVASVLKLNVGNEEVAMKLDAHMKKMEGMMKASPGYVKGVRHVCKTEWAYELSFVWDSYDNFGKWRESELRDLVHQVYLDALKDCKIAEDDVVGGARVHDEW